MTHELRRLITALLPSTNTVHLTALTVEQASVVLQLTAPAPTASYPGCTVSSSSVHSRYGCHLTDLPWGVLAVHIHVIVRKFICRNASCARRSFTERLPAFVALYARKTTRLRHRTSATGRGRPHRSKRFICAILDASHGCRGGHTTSREGAPIKARPTSRDGEA